MRATAIQDAQPTLELLITVRLLAGLTGQPEFRREARTRLALSDLLRPLTDMSALYPSEARTLNAALQAALTPAQAQMLTRARAALEAQVRSFMARARFATPDGPLNLTVARYGLMVPGGPDIVRGVTDCSLPNPYHTGVNAALLERLLTALAP
ncbi:hypothetical protein [Deinococcus aerophilus]|nr:hypothetical protein [Deinococcus aerophilus]